MSPSDSDSPDFTRYDLMRSGDHVFLDQYSHASIVDGAILSKAKTVFFRHNQAKDLDRRMAGVGGRKLVVVEGVYSMDGDFCDLPAILAVAKRHGARILIDEARSAFICGPTGRGVAEHFGLEDEVDLHMGTFSKALGGIGGYFCGKREVVDYLIAYARSRFYSCTLPPPVTAGILASLSQVPSGAAREAVGQRAVYTEAIQKQRNRHRALGLAGDSGDGQGGQKGLREEGVLAK